jgi:hypothetical protein
MTWGAEDVGLSSGPRASHPPLRLPPSGPTQADFTPNFRRHSGVALDPADSEPVRELFDDQPEFAAYADPPEPDQRVHQTLCGT